MNAKVNTAVIRLTNKLDSHYSCYSTTQHDSNLSFVYCIAQGNIVADRWLGYDWIVFR